MEGSEEFGHRLIAEADDIARRITVLWSGLARDEPWLDRYTALTQDHLPEMIRALATAALLRSGSQDAGRGLVRAARQHGSTRRDEGLDDVTIPGEYLLLRRALRPIVAELAGQPALLTSVVAHLELAMGLAEAAALHGYHRDEPDASPPEDLEAACLSEWTRVASVMQ